MPTEEMIDTWFAKYFHGLGPKLDTDLYNVIHAAKEDLKRLIGITAAATPVAASPSPDTAPATEE